MPSGLSLARKILRENVQPQSFFMVDCNIKLTVLLCLQVSPVFVFILVQANV